MGDLRRGIPPSGNGFRRDSYPGNRHSPLGFSPTGVNRYKVIHKPTARYIGMVERVELKGKKGFSWSIVGPRGLPGLDLKPTRSEAAVELYRRVTGKSLSYTRGERFA